MLVAKPHSKMVHLVEWITILVVFCTLWNLCACENMADDTKHKSNVRKKDGLRKLFFQGEINEAQCLTLLKNTQNAHLHKKDLMKIEKKISPQYLQECFKYMAARFVQFNQGRTQHTRRLLRRDADSDNTDTESKETEVKHKVPENKDSPLMESAGTTVSPTFHSPKFKSAGDTKFPQVATSSETDTGLAPWIFILIAVAALVVIIIPLTTAFIYYRKKLVQRHRAESTIPTIAESADLMYDTQRSGSTDKGTERSRSTVSTYLSKYSEDASECHELMPLRSYPVRERSSVIEEFEDTELDQHKKPLRCIEFKMQPPSYEKELIVSKARFASGHDMSLETRGRRSYREPSSREEASPSVFVRSQENYSNKLRGGNTDFHSRNVDYIHNDINLQRHTQKNLERCEQDIQRRQSSHRISLPNSPSQEEDCEFNMYRPDKEYNRNESKSSSSTRSYISIPPTSPSENYVEAGSEDLCLLSERTMPLVKMTWLTKNLEGDGKNEFHNYHANSGTQTDSDSNIKAPNHKTVFGTPWQFGGTFTSRGGVMQAEDSDVCLVLVPNAVPKGEYVDIYGAVFTDTTAIRKKMNLSAKECLITPVVEYCAVPASPFRRPVCVQLPHALPEEFDVRLIKVYTFTVDEGGKVSLFDVPASDKTNEGRDLGTYWEKGSDGHSIHISTYHFSGYFCTQCETNSWPSICTMVFGSHVQIAQSRREVRVILYIWDRRLTIKDYLERFRKQESDVDRQLLTDMQVPLLDSASSDSRLVMCMEVMGGDDDRQCWRHILRPDGSRPLFKPLQVRKLSEIIHCCRQTDPVRVEWALENAPRQVPNAVFQCCVDMMHVHESTSDYETAMREGSDDLMRTFYVRDLKVMTNSAQEPKHSVEFQRVDLKRTLSESMDRIQTERMCQEFGISIKDIGNFRKKYSTSEAFQLGLVEECMRRHGPDKFWNLLPKILERLHYTDVMATLDNKNILVRHLTDSVGVTPESAGAEEESYTQIINSVGGGNDSTRCKSPCGRRSPSPVERNRSNSPRYRRRRSKESCRPGSEHMASERSEDVYVHSKSQHRSPSREEQYGKNRDLAIRQSKTYSKHRQHSPPADYNEDEGAYSQNMKYDVKKYDEKNIQERQPLKKQNSSNSAVDSVLGSRSQPSDNNVSAHFSSRSTLGTSMLAHADPKDFSGPFSDELLNDSMRQTYKKELLVNKHLQGQYVSNEYAPYYNGQGDNHLSSSGPNAIPPETGQAYLSSLSDPVPPYRKMVDSQRSCEKSQLPDKDQTSKKELYGISTVV